MVVEFHVRLESLKTLWKRSKEINIAGVHDEETGKSKFKGVTVT